MFLLASQQQVKLNKEGIKKLKAVSQILGLPKVYNCALTHINYPNSYFIIHLDQEFMNDCCQVATSVVETQAQQTISI